MCSLIALNYGSKRSKSKSGNERWKIMSFFFGFWSCCFTINKTLNFDIIIFNVKKYQKKKHNFWWKGNKKSSPNWENWQNYLFIIYIFIVIIGNLICYSSLPLCCMQKRKIYLDRLRMEIGIIFGYFFQFVFFFSSDFIYLNPFT